MNLQHENYRVTFDHVDKSLAARQKSLNALILKTLHENEEKASGEEIKRENTPEKEYCGREPGAWKMTDG